MLRCVEQPERAMEMLAEVCDGRRAYENSEMEIRTTNYLFFGQQQKDKSYLQDEDASFAFLLLGNKVLVSPLTFSKAHC